MSDNDPTQSKSAPVAGDAKIRQGEDGRVGWLAHVLDAGLNIN